MSDEQRWDWKAALANGSRRTPDSWEPRAGDFVAGRVVERGRTAPSTFSEDGAEYLDLRVIEASQRGEPVEEGSWLRVMCHRARLRVMLREDDPQPGDLVAVEYRGKQCFESGVTRGVYLTVVKKDAADVQAEVQW